MIYIFGLLVAFQIVLGQILWKVGVTRLGGNLNAKFVFSAEIFKLILSPYFIAGVISYGMATIMFMLLLSKYNYTNLQAVVVSSSLTLTFIAASILFDEKISMFNLLGFVFLLCGVVLVTKF